MKNIKYFLYAGIAAVAASCTDLDVPIESQYTVYPDNEIALEAKLADCYYKFRDVVGRRYKEAMTLSSDEMISFSFDGNWLDSYNYSHMYTHSFTSDDASLDWYPTIEGGITNCNNVILQLESMDNADEVLAPVRASRAFYHFVLMDVYGDVPLLDPKLLDDGEIQRTPRAEVAKWIESELLEIIPNLTDEMSDANYGRPTRWMAKALLAKLYINWPVYTCDDITKFDAKSANNEKLDACISVCDDIINSNLFSLGQGYRKKFLPSNGPHIKDFIYAMPYDPEGDIKGMDYSRYTTYKNGKGQAKSYYGFKLENSCGGIFAFNPEFVDLFCLEGDERNGVIVGGEVCCMDGTDEYNWTDEPCVDGDYGQLVFTKKWTLVAQDDRFDVGNDFNAWCQGYKSVKFPPRYVDFASFGRSQTNDYPVFRFADILLTKAEALVRKGQAGNAVALINQVRDCASAPHFNGTPTLKDILDERGREFVNENWRRNDQIRFGTFEDLVGDKFSFTDTRQTFRRVMPLPTSVMNSNTNWKQNTGY